MYIAASITLSLLGAIAVLIGIGLELHRHNGIQERIADALESICQNIRRL